MGRKILAVVLGMVAAFVVITLVEGFSHRYFDITASPNPRDKASFEAYVESLSLGAKLAIPLAYLLGGIAAGSLSRFISKQSSMPTWTCASILTVLTAINAFFIPHPLWLSLLMLVAPVIGVVVGFNLIKMNTDSSTNTPLDYDSK